MKQEHVLDKNGFFFKFASFIHRFYTDEPLDSKFLLCNHFWTIIFFALFVVISFPVMILGYFAMKAGRVAMKVSPQLEALANLTPIGELIDEAPVGMQEKPILFSWIASLIFVAIVAAAAVALFLIVTFTFGLPKLLTWAAIGLGYAGWGLFQGLAGVGWFIVSLVAWTKDFILALCSFALWKAIFIGVVYFVGSTGLIAALLLGLYFVIPKLVKTSLYAKVVAFLRGINGYSEVRKARIEKQKAEEKQATDWICPRCRSKNEFFHHWCEDCGLKMPIESRFYHIFFNCLSWVIWKIPTAKTTVGDTAIIAISPLKFLWTAVKSYKENHCPIIYYFDLAEIKKLTETYPGRAPTIREILTSREVFIPTELNHVEDSEILESMQYRSLIDRATVKEIEELHEYLVTHNVPPVVTVATENVTPITENTDVTTTPSDVAGTSGPDSPEGQS